jgi:hypothetical protein
MAAAGGDSIRTRQQRRDKSFFMPLLALPAAEIPDRHQSFGGRNEEPVAIVARV